MAKKKVEAAEIIIRTTDGGTFTVTGKKAQKLAKDMGGLGRQAQNTDRNMKALSQQSSNATKEFAKMATMQGGLVQVYAVIAAQVFALSAAFQFLKNSMETRNLIEGQKAFGAVTGIAYASMTKSIQDATEGMLSFKEAASAGAIGTAAGLTSGQLNQLGTAAKNASLALGRDLTDSFNRLIRGVTKAEPELLDELGIILRLENATTKYAVSIGKTREQLNAYERTQAVLNDVLEQADTKFSAISKLMDPDAFALGQLMKELDDLLMSFQEFMVKGLLPIIKFFKENSLALVAAMGLFVTPIIKSLLPSLDGAFDASMAKMRTAGATAVTQFGVMRESFGDARAALTSGIDPSEGRSYFDNLGAAQKDSGLKNQARLNKRQIAAYRRHLREKTGLYKKMTARERAELRRHLNMQEALLRGSTQRQISIEKAGAAVWKGIWAGKTAVVAVATTAWQGMLARAAAFANKVFAAAGFLGMAAMIVMGIKSIIDAQKNKDDAYRRSKEETEKLTEAQRDLNDELARMNQVRASGVLQGLRQRTEAAGNTLQSGNVQQLLSNFERERQKVGFQGSDVQKTMMDTARNLHMIHPIFAELFNDIKDGNKVSMTQAENIMQVTNAYINAGQAAKNLTQNQQALNKTLDKQIRKFTKVPFQDLLQQYTTTIQGGLDAYGIQRIQEGAKAGVDFNPDDVTMIGGQMFKNTRGPRGQSVGFRREMFTGNRQRQKERERLQAEFAGQTTVQDYGSITSMKGFDFTNADGTVKSIKEVEKALNQAGFSEDDSFYTVFEKAMNQRLELVNIQEELANIDRMDEEAVEQEKQILETLRQQMIVEAAVLNLQKSGKEFAKEKLEGLRDLTELQTKGTSIENKGLILKQQEANLQDALNDKKLKTEEAGVAQLAVEEKLKGVLQGVGVELSEMEGMKGKELIDKAKSLNISTLELENAMAGVENAKIDETIQANKNELKRQQLQLAATLLINEQGVTDQLRIQAALMRTQAVSAKQIALDVKKNPTSVGKAAARKQKILNIQARTTQNTATAGAYEAQRDDLKASADFGVMGAVDDDGLIIATKNQFQEKYNELLQKEIALKQQNKLLAIDEATLTAEQKGQFIMGNLKATKETAEFQREQVFSLNPATQLYNETVLKLRQAGVKEADIDHKLIKQQVIATKSLQIETELMSGIQNTLSNGFVSMFQAMVDGTKSFKDSMKDLTKQVLTDLAAMFAKAAALKIMLAMFPGMGNMLEGMSSIPGMGRYGGQMTKFRYGGGYALGGIANGPESGYMAMLHGREAVVPLGNDRSIPVDMRGAGGSNTVNVVVNMNGQNSSTNVSGDAMHGLGRSIGGLVQQHLQQEMRPGGLLNPQGTKGRT